MFRSRTGGPARPAAPLSLILVLSGLSAIGPLATDLYLPALPRLADEANATTSAVQLTLTTCLVGLGVGQVVAGPLSDRYGRRRPLLVGLTLFVLSSLACALAPSVPALMVARAVQGLSGAAGLVISRAVVRDLYDGAAVVAVLSRLMLVMGLAPILAPFLGSLLLLGTDWRGLFAAMTVFALVLLVSCHRVVPETRPAAERSTAARRPGAARVLPALLGDRRFVGAVLSSAFTTGAMFTYIAGSSFVFQQTFQLTQQMYALVFGLNALGIIAMSRLSSALSTRYPPPVLLVAATVCCTLGCAGLLLGTLAGAGLPVVVPTLLLAVAPVGLALPNGSAVAMAGPREHAGTASALLGFTQFGVGAATAPLVGAFGRSTQLPMAVIMTGCGVAALVTALLTAGRGGAAAGDHTDTDTDTDTHVNVHTDVQNHVHNDNDRRSV